jgi:heme exporter protein A
MSDFMTRLIADGVGRRFGRRWLFRGVELVLGEGDSLAVTGANGSGKSTLLRILARLLSATEGTVRLEHGGRTVDREAHPLLVGFTAPYLNVYDGFTAHENLAFLAAARRLSGGTERIAALLDRMQLGDRAHDSVATFSSGMRARLKLAAALLARPSVLLLDEPTTNLDERGVALVRDVMDRHVGEGGILVVATNDANEARWCAASFAVGAAPLVHREA